MKTLIAIPTMDQVAAEFAYSLAAMNKVGDCVLGFEISSLIYDARNTLTRKAVNAEADYILWIDSDMVFGQDLMERLMADIEGSYEARPDPGVIPPLFFPDFGYS